MKKPRKEYAWSANAGKLQWKFILLKHSRTGKDFWHFVIFTPMSCFSIEISMLVLYCQKQYISSFFFFSSFEPLHLLDFLFFFFSLLLLHVCLNEKNYLPSLDHMNSFIQKPIFCILHWRCQIFLKQRKPKKNGWIIMNCKILKYFVKLCL